MLILWIQHRLLQNDLEITESTLNALVLEIILWGSPGYYFRLGQNATELKNSNQINQKTNSKFT